MFLLINAVRVKLRNQLTFDAIPVISSQSASKKLTEIILLQIAKIFILETNLHYTFVITPKCA